MNEQSVQGEFLHKDGHQHYVIRNVDAMSSFFISVVSDSDHWLFVGSQGGISAGRVSPETALFPYACVDKLYDTALTSGARTLCKVTTSNSTIHSWEPFNYEQDGRYKLVRNIYKSVLGNALCFEEINHDLQLAFEYTWQFSDEFGLCRMSKISNLSSEPQSIEVLDGVHNVLPAGTPRFTQSQSSNLVDAYKWTELNPNNKLAIFTLYSAITDRAEPVESLRANTVFSYSDEPSKVVIEADAVNKFKRNQPLDYSHHTRGVRGVYLNHLSMSLGAKKSSNWGLVANTEQDQGEVSALQRLLEQPQILLEKLQSSIAAGFENLSSIMGRADAFQQTAEQEVSLHHYANTLFNVMRGGIFANQYHISTADFIQTVTHFNHAVANSSIDAIKALGDLTSLEQLRSIASQLNDSQLMRLVNEYLPITFGRRHGDPSRPWNQFAIKLKDESGEPLLSYQGNWRDIFQNWEALALSYPKFIDSMIAKFVNASTMDGYNPYRITKQGIDWEVEEPDDPWSYIGYWGDHQIIYLLKLLEVSKKFSPNTLINSLSNADYSYANVPYRLRSYSLTRANPKETVDYDWGAAKQIEERVKSIGADGKLVLDEAGKVHQVSLLEKLLVPLMTKLGNLVIGGGIWLNTQRPEWNDANNALVGQGLSMVTTYYIHRYLGFLRELLIQAKITGQTKFEFTDEVAQWLNDSLEQLQIASASLSPQTRTAQNVIAQYMDAMGLAAERYRQAIYLHQGCYQYTTLDISILNNMIEHADVLIKHTINQNKDTTSLYHAYNILHIDGDDIRISNLYPMLEGQVSALSSGALSPSESLVVLERLFNSDLYRKDVKTFMLYADRAQVSFMDKNQLEFKQLSAVPALTNLLETDNKQLIYQDDKGTIRFNSQIVNADALLAICEELKLTYPEIGSEHTTAHLLSLYENTFKHSQFTGRSGGMFGFEGLGCVYWHMVSKLLLAVQELCVQAYEQQDDALQPLIAYYYRVRDGIGFNRNPAEFGGFPTDPYSHTPKHAGAQQPGMTGQVKEELLTRFVELGCKVHEGKISFVPFLLRAQEFTTEATTFKYLDVGNTWQTIKLPERSLAFTWSQVPVIFHLSGSDEDICAEIEFSGNTQTRFKDGELDGATSQHIFERNGMVEQISLRVPERLLYQA